MTHPLSKALREGVQNDGYDYEIAETNRLMAQAADALDARATTESEWQDISTAPKDGTVVLLFCPDALGDEVTTGYFNTPRPEGRYVPHPTVKDAFVVYQIQEEGFWEAALEGSVEPTHWMPLPRKPGEPK